MTIIKYDFVQYVGVVGYVLILAPSHLRAAALGFCASAIFVIGEIGRRGIKPNTGLRPFLKMFIKFNTLEVIIRINLIHSDNKSNFMKVGSIP